MPPKKAAAATDGADGDDGSKTFRWTAENDRKLLILTLNRTLTTDDYHRLVEAMPGTNYNGVRIRVSKMRIEQRKLFEELGWESLDSATVTGGGKAVAPRKRAIKKAGAEEDDSEKAAKKAKKGPKAKGIKKNESEAESEDLKDVEIGVKDEVID